MSDLVKEIRFLADSRQQMGYDRTGAAMEQAPARIEALEAENARLREALQSLLTDWHDCMGHRGTKGERDALAALTETGGDNV